MSNIKVKYQKIVIDLTEVDAYRKKESQYVSEQIAIKAPKKEGEYKEGWTFKQVGTNFIIYNNSTRKTLSHLLEYGHIIKNQHGTYGRTKAIPHIAPVYEQLKTRYSKNIKNLIELKGE